MLHARARFSTRMTDFFASRAANLVRRTALLTGRVTILLFCYFNHVRHFEQKCGDTPHEARFSMRMRGRSTRERDFQPECAHAPRESTIFNERECADAPCESVMFNRNAQTLDARARFSVRMRGRLTREHDFPRECEDAPRESAIFNENDRFFLHRGPLTLYVGPPFSPIGLLFYYFTISTMYAISSKNAGTLHARARFSTRMRGRSTRERNFQPECADAPGESAIFNGNAQTLHARARFSARMLGGFTRERVFQRE